MGAKKVTNRLTDNLDEFSSSQKIHVELHGRYHTVTVAGCILIGIDKCGHARPGSVTTIVSSKFGFKISAFIVPFTHNLGHNSLEIN